MYNQYNDQLRELGKEVTLELEHAGASGPASDSETERPGFRAKTVREMRCLVR